MKKKINLELQGTLLSQEAAIGFFDEGPERIFKLALKKNADQSANFLLSADEITYQNVEFVELKITDHSSVGATNSIDFFANHVKWKNNRSEVDKKDDLIGLLTQIYGDSNQTLKKNNPQIEGYNLKNVQVKIDATSEAQIEENYTLEISLKNKIAKMFLATMDFQNQVYRLDSSKKNE